MLGADGVDALDISDYEGAKYVHDLNTPIPDELEGICDFLVDGSTLDNVWDPCCALRNIGRLLRPGGRCFLMNRSNAGGPGIAYMMFSAPWFFDYFVANDFAYAQIFSTVHADGKMLGYMMSPEAAMRTWGNARVQSLETLATTNVVVYAEKGANSTWAKMPTQASYRTDADWTEHARRIGEWVRNRRHPVLRGDDGPDIDGLSVRYGWERVLPDGTLVRPASGRKTLLDGTVIPPKPAVASS